MARFFFDFHDVGGIFVDGAGEELPNAAIARKEALETVGQAIKDLTFHHSDGRVVIEVRVPRGTCPQGLRPHRNNLLERVSAARDRSLVSPGPELVRQPPPRAGRPI